MNFDEPTLLKAGKALTEHLPSIPEWGIVLGSGLSAFWQGMNSRFCAGFEDLPGIRQPGVEGHPGEWRLLEHSGKSILLMMGRRHTYEGLSSFEASLPAGAMGAAGIKNIILTNAAGGIRADLSPGSLMSITDHINLQSASPLTGHPDSRRFLDMSTAYETGYLKALPESVLPKQGIYAGVAGPQYETPAEIRALRTLGADAVGMSTVGEAILLKYLDCKVFGISVITNRAAGLGGTLSHDEVTRTGQESGEKLKQLILSIIGLP